MPIHRDGKYISLTAQEAAILSKLLETPWSYVRTTLLAHHLSRPGRLMTGTHCIEQTIHTLRRKLGDDKRQPNLILNLRGIGYGIFPEITPPNAQTEQNLNLY